MQTHVNTASASVSTVQEHHQGVDVHLNALARLRVCMYIVMVWMCVCCVGMSVCMYVCMHAFCDGML